MPPISGASPQPIRPGFTANDIVKLSATGRAVAILQKSEGSQASATLKGRGAVSGEIGARGVKTYANYARDVLLGYQQANPNALVVLKDTDPSKADDYFVHPAFAFYALSNPELKRGDKAHFIRSLQNLAAAEHMPYEYRWLAALCVVSCPDGMIIQADRDKILAALGRGMQTGAPIENTRDLARNAPRTGGLNLAKSLARQVPGSLQAEAQQIVRQSEQVIAANPPLEVKVTVSLDVPDADLREVADEVYGQDILETSTTYVMPSATEAAKLVSQSISQDEKGVDDDEIDIENAAGEGMVEPDVERHLEEEIQEPILMNASLVVPKDTVALSETIRATQAAPLMPPYATSIWPVTFGIVLHIAKEISKAVVKDAYDFSSKAVSGALNLVGLGGSPTPDVSQAEEKSPKE